MASHNYHFITHWRVQGTIEDVADIINDPAGLVRWWPSVYLDVELLEPGEATGVGKVVDLYTKGWLPYTLRWQFRVTEIDYPQRFALVAEGDFNGRGVWTLAQDGPWVNVIYDWQIRADKPLLRYLSFLLKPLFSANHHWAMAQGETSLRLELARRQAQTDLERSQIPAPPSPTFQSFKWIHIILGIGLLIGIMIIYRFVK